MRRWTAFLLVALAACGQEGPPAGEVGGAAPTDTLRQPVDPERMLPLVEELRLGAPEKPDETFFRIRGAAIHDDGRIFVLDGGNFRVAVFAPDGRFLLQFGGRGQGPGEFSRAQAFGLRGDSIVVVDEGNRVHLFRTDGTVVHTRAHLDLAAEGDGWYLSRPAPTTDGWIVTASAYFQRTADGNDSVLPPRPRVALHRLGPDGDFDPTGIVWGADSPGTWSGGFWIEPPYAPLPRWAVDGLGRLHATASSDYEWTVYGSDGTAVRTVVNEVSRTPVAGAALDRWKESRCRRGPECDPRGTEVALSLGGPEFVPLIAELQGFVNGHVAVRRADTDPDPFDVRLAGAWDFFAPDGSYMGRVPTGINPRWFDGTTLLAMERDTADVPYIVRYRVDGPSD